MPVAPVAHRYPQNLLTLWDVSSIPVNGVFLTRKKNWKKKKKCLTSGERFNRYIVHKIRLHGRRGKGMAETFFARKVKAHTTEGRWVKNPVWPSFCVTPAGTSNEHDVQNELEENTHTRKLHWFRPTRQKKSTEVWNILRNSDDGLKIFLDGIICIQDQITWPL